MNHTSNYHLPQWVKEDRIMMDDFNDAMKTIDESLTSTKATADGAKSSADESAKAVAEQGKQIVQCREEIGLVKLAGPVEPGGLGTITLDLSRIDMSKYQALFLIGLTGGLTQITTNAGGGYTVNPGSSGNPTYLAWFHNYNGYAYVSALLAPRSNLETTGGQAGKWGEIRTITLTNGAYSATLYGFKA